MEQDLVDALLAYPALAALVGERIDWNVRAQGVRGAAVVLRKVGGGPGHTYDGPQALGGYRIRALCIGQTYPEATDVKTALRAACAAITAAPVEGALQGAFPETEIDSFEPGDGPQGSGPTDEHVTSLDIRVWHSA